MTKRGKETKNTNHISRKMNLLRNGKECNFKNIVWCERGLHLSDIGTKNVRKHKLNYIFGYDMVRLEN